MARTNLSAIDAITITDAGVDARLFAFRCCVIGYLLGKAQCWSDQPTVTLACDTERSDNRRRDFIDSGRSSDLHLRCVSRSARAASSSYL